MQKTISKKLFAFALIAVSLGISSTVLAADKDAEFAATVETAFKTGKKIGTDVIKKGEELWEGECIDVTKNLDRGTVDRTFFGKSILVLRSVKTRGERSVSYGYAGSQSDNAVANYQRGFKTYSLAYLNNEKDLTQILESDTWSGESGSKTYKSIGQTFLRKNTVFEEPSFIFFMHKITYNTDDMKKPLSSSDFYCYFSELL